MNEWMDELLKSINFVSLYKTKRDLRRRKRERGGQSQKEKKLLIFFSPALFRPYIYTYHLLNFNVVFMICV